MSERPIIKNPVVGEIENRDPSISNASGSPVLIGEVQSSVVQGSAFWSPDSNTSHNRMYVGPLDPADSPTGSEPYLVWRAAGQANDDTGYRLWVGPFAGYVDIGIGARYTDGTDGMFVVSPTGSVCLYLFRHNSTTVTTFEWNGTRFQLLGPTAGIQITPKFYPPQDDGTAQSVCAHYSGNGAPNNANGANGDFYWRGDGAAGTFGYHKAAGAWTAFV